MLTYSKVRGKLLGKVLHLSCVDLVVKVDKVAPVLLTLWVMCGWCAGGQDVATVVFITCNQQ